MWEGRGGKIETRGHPEMHSAQHVRQRRPNETGICAAANVSEAYNGYSSSGCRWTLSCSILVLRLMRERRIERLMAML